MALETLTPEEIAASAYRAFASAGNVEEPPVWENEGYEMQAAWHAVALAAMAELPDFNGQPVHKAARWLASIWSKGRLEDERYNALPTQLKLCWEAVTRHLATVLDSDELTDLAGLERSWAEWTRVRSNR